MNHEKLFASFLLDSRSDLEIALQADSVVEATKLTNPFQPLPSGVEYLEGLLQFRNQMIPVVNLKKRLGLKETGYGKDAKIAVIQVSKKRYGLLFEDIRDVLRVKSKAIESLDKTLMSENTVICGLVTLENGKRTLKLLDIDRMFPHAEGMEESGTRNPGNQRRVQRHYSRFVIFSSHGQTYGIPVEDTREICFPSAIDDIFESGMIEGSLKLRGNTIPILDSAKLLGRKGSACQAGSDTRILVMEFGELFFGLIVDRIHEILIYPDDKILAVPDNKLPYIKGICPCSEGSNVMLLNILELIDTQIEKINAVARRRQINADEQMHVSSTTHHIISENCYLVFSIGKHFAIELKDVQEIIETEELMHTTNDGSQIDGLINLRGEIVPVIDLRHFYRCGDASEAARSNSPIKLIIGKGNSNLLALMVDEIVTIYKQEKFYVTPSLRKELQDKKDTLDRLIEFTRDNDVKEHVLVVNVERILANHLFIGRHDVLKGPREEINEKKTAVN